MIPIPSMSSNSSLESRLQQDDIDPVDEQQHQPRKAFCGCCGGFCDRFPRTSTVLFRIVIPLSLLIFYMAICGSYLAGFEAPNEYDWNDGIVARRYTLERFPLARVLDMLFELPSKCWESYLTNKTLLELYPSSDRAMRCLEKSDEWIHKLPDVSIETLLETISCLDLDWELVLSDTRILTCTAEEMLEISNHMKDCGERAEDTVERIIEIVREQSLIDAIEDLSFNWIRCGVNDTDRDGIFRIYSPTQEQLEAALNQSNYYDSVWRLDRAKKYDEYREEGLEHNMAYRQSIKNATGRYNCTLNIAGTSWFWFTIMTTVGYGNQAPVTQSGRYIVSGLGIPSIVAFGAILGSAGMVVRVLFNDLVGRVRQGILNFVKARHINTDSIWNNRLCRPFNMIIATLWWATVSFCWLVWMANYTLIWWKERWLPYADNTKLDSFWFAFITATTIGLGDFFIPPEVIFIQDVFHFSFLFLLGFVLLSSFLNSFGVLLWNLLFNKRKSFEDRIKKTNFLMSGDDQDVDAGADGDDDDDDDDCDSKTIQMLQKLLSDYQANGSSSTLNTTRRSTRQLEKEEELLQLVLVQIKDERMAIVQNRVIVGPANEKKEESAEHNVPSTFRPLATVIQEEALLNQLLELTVNERLKLQENERGVEPLDLVSEPAGSSQVLDLVSESSGFSQV